MVSINYAFKEISCKIVYYGPGLSGKTTNLQYVHKKIPPNTKGDLISLATDADRTLFFDFLPLNIGDVHGFATKFQLYTVPGQVFYNATRKLVLRGVDGLVFVADSQRSKIEENLESLGNLEENLKEYGYDLNKLPMVLQYNKRDLPDVLSLEEMETQFNPKGLRFFESIATKGDGVFDTLKFITRLVLDKTKDKPEVSESTDAFSPVVEMAQSQADTLKSRIVLGAIKDIPEVEETIKETAEEFTAQKTMVLGENESTEKKIGFPESAKPPARAESVAQKEDKKAVSKPTPQERLIAVSVKTKKSPRGFSLWGWIKKIVGK